MVGHVASLTVFAGMADYQWVSPPVRRRRPWRAERTGRDFDKAPCDEETQSLCTVPAIFCRDDIPHDYAYEEAKVQGTLSKGTRVPLFAPITPFSSLPSLPSPGAAAAEPPSPPTPPSRPDPSCARCRPD